MASVPEENRPAKPGSVTWVVMSHNPLESSVASFHEERMRAGKCFLCVGIIIIIIIIIQTFVMRTVSANILNLRRRQSLGEFLMVG